MFDIRKTYGFDKEAAEAGVKMVVGVDEAEDYILVARIPNQKYRTSLTRTMQANSKTLEVLQKQDPDAYYKKDVELNCGVLAESVVLGWGKGILDGGKPLKYSKEVCAKLLSDYPDLRHAIIAFATDPANFPIQDGLDVEDVKKS